MADNPVALSITFTNYTNVDWSRDRWNWQHHLGLSGLNTSPGPVLKSMNGVESLSQSQILSSFVQGPLEIWCCWRDPQGNRIGVLAHANFQMFGLGYRPYWKIMSDKETLNPPNWKPNGIDPSTPYQWTDLPYSIIARPNSEHDSISLEVTISPLEKPPVSI